MSRTKPSKAWHFYQSWTSAHIGKYWRRRLHKAERAYIKGYGRLRSVMHYMSTVNYKNW